MHCNMRAVYRYLQRCALAKYILDTIIFVSWRTHVLLVSFNRSPNKKYRTFLDLSLLSQLDIHYFNERVL